MGPSTRGIVAGDDGTLTVTLSWSNPLKDLDLYVTNLECDIGRSSICTLFESSEQASGTAEQVSIVVARDQKYRVWIWNRAADEPCTLKLVLQ